VESLTALNGEVDEAVAALRSGRPVVLPTDTVYGLCATPYSEEPVRRAYRLKGRDPLQPSALLASDVDMLFECLPELRSRIGPVLRALLPGPLTLVVAASASLARDVTADGTVAVRVPANDVARAIARACGQPITATSANISGQPATSEPDAVERTLGGAIDLLIDTGPTPGGPPSTIVDVTGREPRLVRAGAIPWEEIEACLRG